MKSSVTFNILLFVNKSKLESWLCGLLNDLLVFIWSILTWKLLNIKILSQGPTPRAQHGFSSNGGLLYVHGGYDGECKEALTWNFMRHLFVVPGLDKYIHGLQDSWEICLFILRRWAHGQILLQSAVELPHHRGQGMDLLLLETNFTCMVGADQMVNLYT